jgi:hypothetical protein
LDVRALTRAGAVLLRGRAAAIVAERPLVPATGAQP